jgi:hypothetical protein
MTSTLRPVLAVVVALAAALPLAIAGPAHAESYRPLDERAMAHASLSAADVPRWMRRGNEPQMLQEFKQGRQAIRPDLCPSDVVNNPAVLGRRPQQSMQSVAFTRGGPDAVKATLVESAIFQYRSRSDAKSALAFLNAQAQTCRSFVTEAVDPFGGRLFQEVDTRVRPLPTLFGTPGLEISTDLSAGVENFDLVVKGDVFAHYYLAGTSVVRIQFTNVNGDSRGVGRVSEGFVQTMAIVLAQRVERRSSR